MNFDDGKLVELVRSNSFIYDKNEVLFKNKEARRNVWNAIGSEMEKKGSDCEQRWQVLRTRYNAERRDLKKPSGSAGGSKRKWALYDAFEFLDSHLVQKKTKGNVIVEQLEGNESSLPLDFVYLAEAAETSVLESKSATPAEELFSPSTSIASYIDDSVPQEVTPNISVLRNEGNKRNRNKNRNDDATLNSAIESVQNYFSNKTQDRQDRENGDMCFAKQIYYNLLEIKNKKKKTEIKIKMLNLFLEAEDSD